MENQLPDLVSKHRIDEERNASTGFLSLYHTSLMRPDLLCDGCILRQDCPQAFYMRQRRCERTSSVLNALTHCNVFFSAEVEVPQSPSCCRCFSKAAEALHARILAPFLLMVAGTEAA